MDRGRIRRASDIIRKSKHMIALTGAGISRESNVPTFRGEDGLWRNYNAMELATPQAFANNPKLVWEWYSWRQSLIADCDPNPAHLTLAEWEAKGLLKSIITQNVDGLHHRAGSKIVYEVHGNIWEMRCSSCSYRKRLSVPAKGMPKCPTCGNNLRPDVVWFGESLNAEVVSNVYREIQEADLCLVIGTSALVQPAASFPIMVRQHGGFLIEVNVEITPLTGLANVSLLGKAGELLPLINREL